MKTSLLTVCALSAALGISGCATDLTKAGSQVQIIPPQKAKCFHFVGIVEGSSSQTGLFRHSGYQNALNEALNKAANRGANFIVLSKDSDARYWVTSEKVRAQAYKRPRKSGCTS